ncbi:MAG: hypothetical protein A3C93_01105 [Candidatus Lloydbacteria bacterium RIFCSPHIGHO2_02_FULL_54_17]|uniref:Endonuclease/exonuclease/phosphatase domain-containing protein n=1 Tax=Candidatus Lloydbacteria bacterium RIFCSPHIGHO2_02_FULL_54_17 TaxID=1798664 RepID=A0A1G2DCX3_9BACT|nr:MAG: hypothetical protein A2762_06415 [Candidatus Lloydbacteria bacterium RIFCSPHIGHO2_01_FULL_54_11]OGZ11497.1 MAG: hypothetical protein A3C93_01105 [Candidatus Lloydbacteria bacterium RIFCSPHIGHO2_02_FULL_54_17]OGZ14395.1 MAG: hypothetical protein A2948_00460 [Candidatus Lloydbacteria bacterium RIFCSPLOWO2_01_FULL_54_18]OGZ16810.1 MAG: hypothetical protein A3H76_02130 [Candidatus Lloydbacteria bacterium RIFCSPLOWO2_02_FULL_54_12]
MKKFLIALVCLSVTLAVVWLVYPRHNDQQVTSLKETAIERSGVTPKAPSGSDCTHTFVSWNIANFGRKKTDEEITLMAKVLAHADIVAIQEVTAGKDVGAQAVAKLASALGRTGASWDYIVSDPTQPPSAGVERYVFLWKKHMATINRDEAHLVSELQASVDREPYALTFQPKNAPAVKIFTVHAVPTEKEPIYEIEALVSAKEIANATRAIVAGDFNLPPNKTDPLFGQIGFAGNVNEHTSLKSIMRKEGHTARQYDNVYTKGVTVCKAGAIDFVQMHFAPVTQESLRNARRVSDHLPVFVNFR